MEKVVRPELQMTDVKDIKRKRAKIARRRELHNSIRLALQLLTQCITLAISVIAFFQLADSTFNFVESFNVINLFICAFPAGLGSYAFFKIIKLLKVI